MSFKVVSEVLEHSEVEHTERLVLIAIAEAAHHDGVSWIPMGPREDRKTIAFRARASLRAVERAVSSLEVQVEVERRKAQRRHKRINVYRVLCGAMTFVDVDYDRLPFTIDQPFSTAREILELRGSARQLGGSSSPEPAANLAGRPDADEPPILAVTDRQSDGGDPPPASGRTSLRTTSLDPATDSSGLDPLKTTEDQVPAGAGDGPSGSLPDQLLRVFAEEFGTWPQTRGEWGAWKKAFKQLAETEQPTVDEFRLVARAYCDRVREQGLELPQAAFGLQTAWMRISAALQASYFALYRWTTDSSWRIRDPGEVEWILRTATRLDDVQRAELLELAQRVADAHTDAGSAVLAWVESAGWAIEDEQQWARELATRLGDAAVPGTKAPSIKTAALERRVEIRRALVELKFRSDVA